MSEPPKVIKLNNRRKKAGGKGRPTNRAAARLKAVPPAAPPPLESLIDAKIEQRFAEFEQRMERSFKSIESKLEQATMNTGRSEPAAQNFFWVAALSAFEKLGPLADLKPLVGDWAALGIEQLEKLGFIQVLSQTFTSIVNHISMGVDEFGYDQEFEDKMRPLLEFLFYRWWRVEMSGVEHVPGVGRALLVSNHSGTLPFDGAMIKFGVRELHPNHRIARVLMHDLFNSLPVLGPILGKLGAVRACQENGEKLLLRGHVTMVFPEGAKGTGKYFKNRYKLERFGRGGFVQLAARARSPIVPIAVVGAEEIYPIIENSTVVAKLLNVPYFPITPTFPWLGVLGLIPLPSKWSIDIGEPITFDHLSANDLEDDFLIDHLGNEVRLKIQKMIDDRLKQRGSVWLG
jgi:1-acyl-sn-glycerol-3-phosphate acyltransferase